MEPIVLAATIISGVLGPVGIFIGVMTWRNGRALRDLIVQESRATRELISELGSKLAQLISAESAGIRQILERMDYKLDAIYSQVTKS